MISLKKISCLFTLLLLTSCATELDFKMPINKMMTPESTGKSLGFQGYISYGGSQKVRLGSVADTLFNSVSINTEQGISDSTSLGLGARLGLAEKLDLYLTDSDDTSLMFGGKYQVLGNSFTNKKDKDFQISVAFGVGTGAADEGSIITNDDKRYTTELELFSYEYMVLLGYRLNKNALFYSTFYKASYNVEAALKQNGIAISNGTIDGDSDMTALNIGAKLNDDKSEVFGQLEVGYGYGKYENSLSKHTVSYALNIGIIH